MTTTPGASAPERLLGAEWDEHERTFMSWPTEAIWGRDTPEVTQEIARLAQTISQFEPVTLLASPEHEQDAAERAGSSVSVLPLAVDDLWARDTVPVFVATAEGIEGVDLQFNGWGGKQEHADDAAVARSLLEHLGIARTVAGVVGEGGSLETDGEGTLLVTRSSLVNDNRNPGMTQEQVQAALIEAFGTPTVIWCDGVKGHDITDAHIDSLVRFVAPGTVLLDVPGPGAPQDVWARSSAEARAVLSQATDARGRSLEIIELPQPDFGRIRGGGDELLAPYVNFYIANGAVLLPEFGDRDADDRAQRILGEHFPDRQVVPVAIDAIASGGGGIHCATHDLPRRASS